MKLIFDEIFGLYKDAGVCTYPCDPLIFDLNGDGVKTVSLVDAFILTLTRTDLQRRLAGYPDENYSLDKFLNDIG